MENSAYLNPRILTALKYLDWREDMKISLCNKGLHMMTMGRAVKSHQYIEKLKHLDRIDEAFGYMCIHISRELLFIFMESKIQKKYGISSNPCLENKMS